MKHLAVSHQGKSLADLGKEYFSNSSSLALEAFIPGVEKERNEPQNSSGIPSPVTDRSELPKEDEVLQKRERPLSMSSGSCSFSGSPGGHIPTKNSENSVEIDPLNLTQVLPEELPEIHLSLPLRSSAP